MADIRLRASRFDPPETARGPSPGAKVIEWSATITHQNLARPMVRAVRANASEALDAAAERFLAIFRDGRSLDPFEAERTSSGAKKDAASKARAARKHPKEDDDDWSSLI
jgi:hypothetical protein